MHSGYFDIARKGNHSSFLAPAVVGERRPVSSEFCTQSDPLRKSRLRDISAYNVSTLRDGEKVQLRIGSRAIDGVRTLPLSPPKGG